MLLRISQMRFKNIRAKRIKSVCQTVNHSYAPFPLANQFINPLIDILCRGISGSNALLKSTGYNMTFFYDLFDLLIEAVVRVTKKILGGQALRFLYQQGVRILPLPPGAGGDGVQLPVLLLPALYAGAEVRGKLHLFGKRRQGLQQVPGTPPPGELWIYCRQFPEDCWRDGGTGEEGRTVNEGSSLYIPRCTWKKRPTAMRRRALF